MKPARHYQNKDATKWAFYDRSIRSWTCTERDAEGNQVGSAIYFANKTSAFAWLKELNYEASIKATFGCSTTELAMTLNSAAKELARIAYEKMNAK